MPIKQQVKRRNPLATVALLRKGGVHEKSRTSKRQTDKRKLNKAVSNWYEGHDSDPYATIQLISAMSH